MFEVRSDGQGGAALVGRLDASEVDAARRSFDALQGNVVLDCSRLDYVSSAGIGLLMETHKRLMGTGHKLALARLLPRVRNVFVYAGLDRVLTLE
jgi:anti-sigma B factor antagonist